MHSSSGTLAEHLFHRPAIDAVVCPSVRPSRYITTHKAQGEGFFAGSRMVRGVFYRIIAICMPVRAEYRSQPHTCRRYKYKKRKQAGQGPRDVHVGTKATLGDVSLYRVFSRELTKRSMGAHGRPRRVTGSHVGSHSTLTRPPDPRRPIADFHRLIVYTLTAEQRICGGQRARDN